MGRGQEKEEEAEEKKMGGSGVRGGVKEKKMCERWDEKFRVAIRPYLIILYFSL